MARPGSRGIKGRPALVQFAPHAGRMRLGAARRMGLCDAVSQSDGMLNSTTDPYPNPAPPVTHAQAPGLVRAEPDANLMETYARQTRNATVTIVVCTVFFTAISIIAGILVAIAAAHFNSLFSNGSFGGTSSTSNCMSQGSTDPSC